MCNVGMIGGNIVNGLLIGDMLFVLIVLGVMVMLWYGDVWWMMLLEVFFIVYGK